MALHHQGPIYNGYAPLPIIHQKNSSNQIQPDHLEIFYNEEALPGGRFPDGSLFRNLITRSLNTNDKKIGEGVFGNVYLLTFGDQQYALKKINVGNSTQIQYVKQEIEILRNLIGKPFAVQLLGSIITYDSPDSGTAYLLYPFIPGMTLDAYQQTHKTQTKESIEIFEKIIDAVKALHDTGILHSDIKPENIWIPNDRSIPPFLLDFGLSQTLFNKDGKKVNYARPVGTYEFWSDQRMINTLYDGKNYPMTTGINWNALAKTLGESDPYQWNAKARKSITGQAPLNRKGRFKKKLEEKRENKTLKNSTAKTLTYEDLKEIITEMKKNENTLSGGTRRYIKYNRQKKQNKRTRQNKKNKEA